MHVIGLLFEASFNAFKVAITQLSILILLNFIKLFIVKIDASSEQFSTNLTDEFFLKKIIYLIQITLIKKHKKYVI